LGFLSLSLAQQPAAKPSMVQILNESILGFCPLMMKSMAEQIAKQSPFVDQAKLIGPVCGCMNEVVHSDSRIHDAFSLPNPELQAKFVSSQLKTYLFSRMSSSLFTCLGANLKEQTDSANLVF